jgi:hypothetical protein
MKYDARPPTDDSPYFILVRRSWSTLQPDASIFSDKSMANWLNKTMPHGVPVYEIHFVVTGVLGILFASTFILIPMMFSRVGRATWPNKCSYIIYFSCLASVSSYSSLY